VATLLLAWRWALEGVYGHPDEPLTTMAVASSRDAAEQYLNGDPFYIDGKISMWSIREWANMFA
jgi:hypothetical protein